MKGIAYWYDTVKIPVLIGTLAAAVCWGWAQHLMLLKAEKAYSALIETRTGEVLDEKHSSTPEEWSTTGTEFAYHVNGGRDLVRVVNGVGPCKNDDPIAHHSLCIDGNTLYVIPPYTGWVETTAKMGNVHLFMRKNQPCGMYIGGPSPFPAGFDSDTEPIRMYRTEREARHAVEEGCKP